MSQPTGDRLSEQADVGKAVLRDESFVLGMERLRAVASLEILTTETCTVGGSLLTEGSTSSTTSVETITLDSCLPDPSVLATELSRNGSPTPPPIGSSAANRHGKFKKSLEDRYRIGQGSGDNLSRACSASSLPATSAIAGQGRHSTLKLLQVDAVLSDATGSHGLRDGEPRKSHSMDEGGRKSRSVDTEWPAPRASSDAGRGVRSSSFDPCSSVAAEGDDSPLDLSSRSASSGGGSWPPTSSSSSTGTSDMLPARRDACRNLFEARARERHLRKRSESEENIHISYNGITTAALAFPPVGGRLYHSDLRIDQSGRNGTANDAGNGHDLGPMSMTANAATRDPNSLDQPPMSSAAHLGLRRRQQRANQHRQKSCSPTPCLGRRLLQPTASPKGYSSSLEDGSPNRLPSDDEARLPAVRAAGDSALMRPLLSSSEMQRNGICSLSTAAAPGWRVTPPAQLSVGPDSMDDGSGCGCGSPSGHSPGGSTLSADDLSAVTSAGGSGSLDDASAAMSGGAGSPGAAGGARLHFCHVCERSFSRSDMLTRHVRLHTGLKPYECQLCGQQFSRSDHLSTHQRTHTGERPYRCPHCPYAACRRDMITRHLRVHGRSSSGGGSSEDDAGCGLLATSAGVAAAAIATAAPVPGDVTVATSAADVRIKRRRLLQRGPWSGSGGSSGGGGSAATDLSSSWDSSLSYSFGSSSIESASGCTNAADVPSAAAAYALGTTGTSGGSTVTCGWLQALPPPRADAAGRSWRWSSNGSSSSSSGLGASLGCSSPDTASGSGSSGCRTFGNSVTAPSTVASGATALPSFADVSWADACERTAHSAAGDVLLPSGRTQVAAAMATVAAAVERAASCSIRPPAAAMPLWNPVPFGFGRPGLPAAAGGGSLPAAAMAAAALLYASPSPTLALFGNIGTAGLSVGTGERSQTSLQSAAAAAASALGRSRAGDAATATEPMPVYDASSTAASAKERKSLVRQDASMEQEDESPPPGAAAAAAATVASGGTSAPADVVKCAGLPAATVCSAPLPLHALTANPLQQLTLKTQQAASWLPHPRSTAGNTGGSALASTAAAAAAAFVPGAPAAAPAACAPGAASLAIVPLPSSAATAAGGLRQASLSDELGKVSMTE